MLYPTELSSGGRTGFEPVANGVHRCSTSELSPARGTSPRTLRHTPRQRRAHRTGRKPEPLQRVRRCSALAPVQAPIRFARSQPPAARVRHHGRSVLATPVATPRSGNPDVRAIPARMPWDAGAVVQMSSISVCERAKQNAPGCRVRGRSRSSEIGATDLRDEDQSIRARPGRRA